MISPSLSGKEWVLREADEDRARRISERHDLSMILARILSSRGLDDEAIISFLSPRLRDLLPDPSTLADMDKAVDCVARAVLEGEPIALFGDYDVDGISAVALLKRYFDALGCSTQTHLPDRVIDGYGLNEGALDEVADSGCCLVITVDCGAKDIDALNHARGRGLTVIILDHHPTREVPPAYAFVNPNGPDDKTALGYLTAVGVAFMFLVGLNRFLRSAAERRKIKALPDLKRFLDLVALGTICDVAPLVELNRAFVQHGLGLLARENHKGLALLAKSANQNRSFQNGSFDVESFSFSLGPRLNAAGRIGKPDIALALLTEDDEEELARLTAQLNTFNRQRQLVERAVLEEAVARLGDTPPAGGGIVIAGEGWHVGVIGIVAARLRDLYGRPAAVIALDGGRGIGSIRGDGVVDLGALVHEAGDLLVRGGGHRQAAGFTIDEGHIESFADFFSSYCERSRTNSLADTYNGVRHEARLGEEHIVDGIIDFSAANLSLYQELQRAAPFGKGNPSPCFLFTDACLVHTRVSARGHLRCRFRPAGGGAALDVVGFNQGATPLGLKLRSSHGEVFHIVGSLRPAWLRAGSVEIALMDIHDVEAIRAACEVE